jgi:hypothetical protein
VEIIFSFKQSERIAVACATGTATGSGASKMDFKSPVCNRH